MQLERFPDGEICPWAGPIRGALARKAPARLLCRQRVMAVAPRLLLDEEQERLPEASRRSSASVAVRRAPAAGKIGSRARPCSRGATPRAEPMVADTDRYRLGFGIDPVAADLEKTRQTVEAKSPAATGLARRLGRRKQEFCPHAGRELADFLAYEDVDRRGFARAGAHSDPAWRKRHTEPVAAVVDAKLEAPDHSRKRRIKPESIALRPHAGKAAHRHVDRAGHCPEVNALGSRAALDVGDIAVECRDVLAPGLVRIKAGQHPSADHAAERGAVGGACEVVARGKPGRGPAQCECLTGGVVLYRARDAATAWIAQPVPDVHDARDMPGVVEQTDRGVLAIH